MTELAGRVALVTGASRGIGEASARALAALGAKVIVSDLAAPEALAEEQLGDEVGDDGKDSSGDAEGDDVIVVGAPLDPLLKEVA